MLYKTVFAMNIYDNSAMNEKQSLPGPMFKDALLIKQKNEGIRKFHYEKNLLLCDLIHRNFS